MKAKEIKTPQLINAEMIAPCGMNCAICIGFLRDKNPCPGCLGDDQNKPKHCVNCSVVICPELEKQEDRFCYDCEKLPCKRLKTLDKRYRAKYSMSMLENLENIKVWGIEKFIASEQKRWTCPQCGALLSAHRDDCLNCGYIWEKRSYT